MNNLNPKYFLGSLVLDKPLISEQQEYLQSFSKTKRMKRDAIKAALLPDPIRNKVFLDIGEEGGYYVGGEEDDDSIVKKSLPPVEQPTLWCKWCPSDSGKSIVWSGNKFFGYIEWLEYIIEHFLITWGREVSGMIDIRNDQDTSLGYLKVIHNKVELKYT